MDKNYGGAIWTNHALDRLKQRGIKQSDAWATFNRPEQSRPASTRGATIYYRRYGNERLEVVASKNDQGTWVIMTVWSRPLFQKKYSKHHPTSSFWDRLLESFLGKIFGKR
jgi:hypothetical protein